ncbi:MAG: tripartite tricarboxylate transporter permease [Propionibacteriaceae bacterium]|nr:tripartite tricarboxylate transporter permease [Propionibacteriaceae bacterium]
MEELLQGFAVALQPIYLLYGLVGALVGTAIGVLPGLGKTTTIALLLPLTYQLGDPVGAFILFGGVYYGAAYGGSTAAILVNAPGEADSVVSALDGHQLVKRGRAGAALMTAAVGSFLAGTVGTLALVFLADPMVALALAIGPVEFFSILVLGLSLVAMLGGQPVKALFSMGLGLALGTVGIDLNSGQSRFTFGIPELFEGFDFVVVAVGLFAVSEVFVGMSGIRRNLTAGPAVVGKLRMTREEFQHSWPAWLRGTATGFIAGILPGAGNTVSTFLSYGVERTFARPVVPFGTGAIEGLAGPEAANNAASSAGLAPLLFLGIPGSASTAVMLAGLQGHGLPTGPLLLQERPDLVWGLLASLLIANALLLVLNLPLIGVWVRMLSVPPALLYPLVLAVCIIGVYGMSSRVFDLWIMLAFGLLGLAFRLADIPIAPLVLALILSPMLETQTGRALTIARGDWTTFFTHPVALVFYALSLAIILTPVVSGWMRRRRDEAKGKDLSNTPAAKTAP